MHQLTVLKIVLGARLDAAHRKSAAGQRGASAVEWVIITALLITIAIAVGLAIKNKLTDKANNLNLDTPN